MRVALLLLACAFDAQANFMEVNYDEVSTMRRESENIRQDLPERDRTPETCTIENQLLWQGSEHSPCDESISYPLPWEEERR